MLLLAFGVNHRTAPVAIRERVSFPPERVGEALHELGFRTESGDVEGLVAFASLFSFDVTDQGTREENFNRLVEASKENPLVKIPDELIMVGRVLIVQTGLLGHIRPTWRMEDVVAARLASSER